MLSGHRFIIISRGKITKVNLFYSIKKILDKSLLQTTKFLMNEKDFEDIKEWGNQELQLYKHSFWKK